MNLLDKCLCGLLKQNGIFRITFKYFKLKSNSVFFSFFLDSDSLRFILCVCVSVCTGLFIILKMQFIQKMT